MTDFLDRLVARVLPGQGGQAVVRTRPRSRFEQGVPTGVSDQGGEGSGSEGEVQEASPGEGPRSGSPVGSPGESGQPTGSTVSPRGARTSASVPAPGGMGPGAGEGSTSRGAGVLRQGEHARGRPGGEVSALVAPSGERPRGPVEEGRGVADPDAVLRPVPRRSAVGGEGTDGAALAPEERGGDSPRDPGGRSRSQQGGMEAPLSPTDPGSPAPVLRPLPATPSVPGSLTPAVPGAEDVRGAREGASAPEQPVVHLRPAPRPRAPETAPEPAPVQLRIGRVEIRGNEPAPTHRRTPLPPPQPRSPALDLAEYLRRRNSGRRP